MIISQIQTPNGLLHHASVEQALEAGATSAQIDTALDAHRLSGIKAECSRRIYAVVSAEAQINIACATSVIVGKLSGSRSSAEASTLSATGMETDWVAAMRANIAVLAADSSVDYLVDDSWPTCPPDVVALASQF